jgi:AcrR family transcriptional regulator
MALPVPTRILATEPRLPGTPPRGTAGQILEVALGLFARVGYHGTSIRDLGKALGLKPANLYEHYESKEHVLAELVRIGHAEHLRALRTALVSVAGGPAEQLQALVAAHVRTHAEYAMLAVVANNELHALSAELAAPAMALRQQSEALLYDVVARGTEARLFDPPDARLTAAAIGGMGLRVAHWYRADLSIDHLASTYAELALRMVGATRRRK